MGCCFSNCVLFSSNTNKFALKFPHGSSGIEYNEKIGDFVETDIQEWLHQIYNVSPNRWTNWLVYNDEIEDSNITTHGHCKGILAWSLETRIISWMCHSVPKFPREFDAEKGISKIEEGQLEFGQSFQYLEIPYSEHTLKNILFQIHLMDANIYTREEFKPHSGSNYLMGQYPFIKNKMARSAILILQGYISLTESYQKKKIHI